MTPNQRVHYESLETYVPGREPEDELDDALLEEAARRQGTRRLDSYPTLEEVMRRLDAPSRLSRLLRWMGLR
jgi:hypothetical protein